MGYDIAFAYELAYDLGCKLELVPLSYQNLIDELNEGSYDIAMSAVTINEARLKALTFTEPYLSIRLCFVVQEKMRKKFATIESIIENKHIKIAVLKGSSYESPQKNCFPIRN